MELILDIETDSLTPTKIHCIVCKEINIGEYYKFIEQECYTKFPLFSKNVTKFIGHNIVSFDAYVLNKLTGSNIKLSQLEDTLIFSLLLNPDLEGGHSLEAWGNRLGFPKIVFNDFTKYSEGMLDYCTQDVDLTYRLYINLKAQLKTEKISNQAILLEHQVRAIVDKQERNGFQLDVKKSTNLVAMLLDKKDNLERQVRETFKPLPVFKKEVIPRLNKDGKLSTVGLKHIEDLTTVAGPHSIIEYPEFNLGSRQQVAKQLLLRGWKPTKFTEKDNIILDETELRASNIPEALLVADYMLHSRYATLAQSWVNASDDKGLVHGSVFTIGANTFRMAHSNPNIAQVPAVYSPYGKECRGCFTVRDSSKYVLVGCDASGLELRTLAHYINDPEFTKEVVFGDIHTKNQNAAGLKTRDQAKTFIYAWMYGAGAAKIGSIIDGTKTEGQKLIDRFLERTPKLKALKDKVTMMAGSGKLPGLDGRILRIRSAYSSLNTLNQSAGAIVCKQWLVEIIKLANKAEIDYNLVASIHDEYQFEVEIPRVKEFGNLTKEAMKLTEKLLKVRCPLDSEFKIGNNWAETH